MPDPPVERPRGEEPSQEDDEGVVLFDPAGYVPYEATTRRPGGPRGVVAVLIGLPLLAAVGYGVYTTRDIWMPQEPVEPVQPTLIETESMPQEPMLEALSRTELSGPVDSSVVLTVRAMGSLAPIADSSVLFEVTAGEGTLAAESARTDARGIARMELALPSQVGMVSVTARLAQSELSTAFMVSVVPGAAARIAEIRGDRQVAEVQEMVGERVGVVVTDASGNPVPGVEVRFAAESGSGMVAPSRTRSSESGLAAASWRLGEDAGTHRVVAMVPSLDTAVTFTANATARPDIVEARPQPVEAQPVTVVHRDFVIGNSHVCALVGGAVTCRGASVRGQSAVASSGLVALATGISHVCGLNPIGDAVCWGANEGGQLGDGTRTDRESPSAVRTELHFSVLTAGATHTCGLAGGGVPICWGQNLNGQVGDGSRIDRLAPTTVGGGLRFTSLVAGWNHTCGLSDNGNAWCWGLNSDGQLGDGNRLDQLTPTLVTATVQSLAAGSAHTCGLGGGQVMCWGDNRFGQLGDGTTQGRAQPTAVQGLPGPASRIAAGAVHTCALVDGAAYCWGQNLHGQLGDGSRQNRTTATAVAGGIEFRSIYAGGALTCGFSTDGSQYCWGLNQSGQLGDGTRESRSTPTLIG